MPCTEQHRLPVKFMWTVLRAWPILFLMKQCEHERDVRPLLWPARYAFKVFLWNWVTAGIPPDSSTWSGGLGLGTLHVGELWTGRRNSRDTTGEGCKLFCNSCCNKLSVTVTVTVCQRFNDSADMVTMTMLRDTRASLGHTGGKRGTWVPECHGSIKFCEIMRHAHGHGHGHGHNNFWLRFKPPFSRN